MTNRTLAIIKPDAVKKMLTGKIIDRILKGGFAIIHMKQIHLTKKQAEGFYAIHRDKPFYNDLVAFMSSAPCIVLVLKKENAVDELRKVMGATNPDLADEGTIRKDFADNIQNNAIHGSDSNENAIKEIAFFFSTSEIL